MLFLRSRASHHNNPMSQERDMGHPHLFVDLGCRPPATGDPKLLALLRSIRRIGRSVDTVHADGPDDE
jgi:hypothetical protein